ncbi:MAG: PEP-CTERM sorting domain-containing protein [Cyanobacteria bacterium P01_H01_bin.121]
MLLPHPYLEKAAIRPSQFLGALTVKGSVAAAGAILSFTLGTPVEAATFDLNWTGQTLGYTAEGRFSFDDASIPADGIIRSEDVTSFEIAFFTPEGGLMESFADNQTTPGFNFNFDTTTGEILQTGLWDTPTGINIGGIRGEQLNFFSVPNPKADLFGDDTPSPHVHLTDWGNDYADLPVGFDRGARPHLDIAFFNRTQAEVLADPTASEALGQRLVATKVPEPATWFGLGAIALALRLKPKSRS